MSEYRPAWEYEIEEAIAVVKAVWDCESANQFFLEINPTQQYLGPLADSRFAPMDLVVVAKDEEKIVGIIMLNEPTIDFDIFGITWLCVLEEYRGRGHGTMLLRTAERLAKLQREQYPLWDSDKRRTFIHAVTQSPQLYANLDYDVLTSWGPSKYLMSKEII